MTDRQRFINQMHYKPIDRCFNMEFGYWEENFKQWPIFLENGITSIEKANRFFSFDPIERVIGHGWLWLNPLFEEQIIQETASTKILRNKDGLLAEIPKDGHDTIPHFLESSVKTPDDWRKVKDQRLRRDDPARKPDIEALKQQYPSDRDYPVGLYCGSMIGVIRNLLTFEGLAYAAYDYPDMVEDMVETACVLVEDYLDQVLGAIEFDYACGWEDICFKNGPIVSVDFFKNVVVPRYKRIRWKLHNAGIDIWYTDCDGDVRPILPLFLECGINCLFPYEVNSCAHPADVLNEYGTDLRIMGAFDKMQLKQGRGAIKAYMKSLLSLVERGGFIPFCDHRCPPDVNPDDYLYYLELKEQMFGMK
jgi:uroporphyrinogen decarboxylase